MQALFFWKISQIPGFGRTKGEIRVEKGVFRELDLVWESATPPTHIWERSPKKTVFGYPPLQFQDMVWKRALMQHKVFYIFNQKSSS